MQPLDPDQPAAPYPEDDNSRAISYLNVHGPGIKEQGHLIFPAFVIERIWDWIGDGDEASNNQRFVAEQARVIEAKEQVIAAKDTALAQVDQRIAAQEKQISELKDELAKLRAMPFEGATGLQRIRSCP